MSVTLHKDLRFQIGTTSASLWLYGIGGKDVLGILKYKTDEWIKIVPAPYATIYIFMSLYI